MPRFQKPKKTTRGKRRKGAVPIRWVIWSLVVALPLLALVFNVWFLRVLRPPPVAQVSLKKAASITKRTNSTTALSSSSALPPAPPAERNDLRNEHDEILLNWLNDATNSTPLMWKVKLRRLIQQQLAQGPLISNKTVFVGLEQTPGVITTKGQLIVQVNHTFAFWGKKHLKLCQLVRYMTLRSTLDYGYGESVLDRSLSLPAPLLRIALPCDETTIGTPGQGNWLTAHYSVRMLAALAKVDYEFACLLNPKKQAFFSGTRDWQLRRNIMAWFDGSYPAPEWGNNGSSQWPYDGDIPPTDGEVCYTKYGLIGLDRIAHVIQGDLRNMAMALVGPPPFVGNYKLHPNYISNHSAPMFPNVTLDQVSIHFRCGDIMGDVPGDDYKMIHFSEYPKWIDNATTTIGIVTHSFQTYRNRFQDQPNIRACQQATYLLVEYLQAHFPQATISIRNDEQETMPLSYARLVMAQQAFTSISSFGIFPVMGTFGRGYFQRGNRKINPFVSKLPQYLPNLVEMNAPAIGSATMKRVGLNATLKWLVTAVDDSQLT